MSLKYQVIKKPIGIKYLRYGVHHRVDGPSEITRFGYGYWYQYFMFGKEYTRK